MFGVKMIFAIRRSPISSFAVRISTTRAYPSAMVFRSASPFSKSPPTILSMLKTTPIITSGLRQVGGELVHGSAPTLPHAIMCAVECRALLRARIKRRPLHRERRPTMLFGEAECRQHLERPRGAHRMTRDAAVLVRE